MWVEVKENADIDVLLNLFGNFHCSNLRDIYISTREFVDRNQVMHFNNKVTASLIFQRQYKSNPVIEIKIEDVKQINFFPLDEIEYSTIYDVTLRRRGGFFYWADVADWEMGDNKCIWVGGKKLFWRFRPELIGNIQRVNIDCHSSF